MITQNPIVGCLKFKILKLLNSNKTITVQDLVKRTEGYYGSIKRCLKLLIKDGFVENIKIPNQLKAVMLTEFGKEYFQTWLTNKTNKVRVKKFEGLVATVVNNDIELLNEIIEKNFAYRIDIIANELKKQHFSITRKEILKRVMEIEQQKKATLKIEEKERIAQAKREIVLPCSRKLAELFGKKCWENRCYLKEKCGIYERR